MKITQEDSTLRPYNWTQLQVLKTTATIATTV